MTGRTLHLGALLGGFGLLLTSIRFLSVYPSEPKFGGAIDAPGRALTHISEGEFRFWLAMFLIATPGCVLMAHAFERRLGPVLRGWVLRFDDFGAGQWLKAGLLYFALLFGLALLGNDVLLLGHQITDDESGVRFGGQLWAAGKMLVPALEPPGAWNDIYLYRRDGLVGSMDWPGVIGVSALGTLTGLTPAIYALLAAGAGLSVVATGVRLFGPRAAPVAGMLWLLSPMAFTLSVSNHAHLVSRTWVALAIYLFARLCVPRDGERAVRAGLALGVVIGLGAGTRPFEMGALMAPAGLVMLVQAARRREGLLAGVVGAALGMLPLLLLHGIYNHYMTGDALLSPRVSENIQGATMMRSLTMWDRAGLNLGHNVLMLTIWFWGPLGLVLAWTGACQRGLVVRALAAGVVAHLAVALAHSDVGIHTVGPIHYSETVAPLVVLATGGVMAVVRWLTERKLSVRGPAVALLGYALAMAFFILQYSGSLRRQGEFLDFPYLVLRHHGVERGIVLAPPPAARDALAAGQVGSWQLMEPMPDPFLRGDFLFPRWETDVNALHAHLPDRKIYRMHVSPTGTALVPVEPDAPQPAPGTAPHGRAPGGS